MMLKPKFPGLRLATRLTVSCHIHLYGVACACVGFQFAMVPYISLIRYADNEYPDRPARMHSLCLVVVE